MPQRPKNESLQERRLEQAQRMLDRIRKQEEKARRLVELELRRLDDLRKAQGIEPQESSNVQPGITSASPAAFNSQYDQFRNTLSGERLSTEPADILRSELIRAPKPNENVQSYNFASNGLRWDKLTEYPGMPVYASGYYFSDDSPKEYEYRVEPSAYPIAVGDMVEAPVHLKGYHMSGNPRHEHLRRFIITDLYSQKRFIPYHDDIE